MSSKGSSAPLPSEAAKISRSKKSKWPWGVWATLGYTLMIFILPQIILASVLPSDRLDEIADGDNILLNFSILVVGEIITLSILISILKSRKKRLKDIFVKPAKPADMALAIPVYGIYLVSTMIAFILASSLVTDQTLDQEQEIGFETAGAAGIEQLIVFIGLVLIVPFIEETLFRGFMLRGFVSRMGWVPASLLSSFFFGLAHAQLNVGIDTFILGLAAAWLVYFSKSVWPAIVLHMIKNAVAFVILFEYVSL